MAWLVTILTLGVAAWLARAFAHPKSSLHILDYPNERSLHSSPTPRTGGVAIVIAIIVGGALLQALTTEDSTRELPWLGAAAAMVSVVSYLDDRRPFPVVYRLMTHVFAAGLLVAGGLAAQVLRVPGADFAMPGWLAAVSTVLFVVWMTNLYNFMDGMDGFAGGMAVFGFGVLAVLGGWAGNELFASLNLVVAAAAGGFLLLNFPPARIFMGDTGSSTLGFLAAGMTLWADNSGVAPLWISVLIFLPFISDATVTLVRRLMRGERVWEAHRTHFYQRLVQLGWGHRKTVLVEYGLMALCAVAALAAVGAAEWLQWIILVSVLLIYGVVFGWIRWFEVRAVQVRR